MKGTAAKVLIVLLRDLEKGLAWLYLPFVMWRWAPHWLYKVKLVPWSWVTAPQEWATRHGLYDIRTGRWGRS